MYFDFCFGFQDLIEVYLFQFSFHFFLVTFYICFQANYPQRRSITADFYQGRVKSQGPLSHHGFPKILVYRDITLRKLVDEILYFFKAVRLPRIASTLSVILYCSCFLVGFPGDNSFLFSQGAIKLILKCRFGDVFHHIRIYSHEHRV